MLAAAVRISPAPTPAETRTLWRPSSFPSPSPPAHLAPASPAHRVVCHHAAPMEAANLPDLLRPAARARRPYSRLPCCSDGGARSLPACLPVVLLLHDSGFQMPRRGSPCKETPRVPVTGISWRSSKPIPVGTRGALKQRTYSNRRAGASSNRRTTVTLPQLLSDQQEDDVADETGGVRQLLMPPSSASCPVRGAVEDKRRTR